VLLNHQVIEDSRLIQTEFYNGFLRPQNLFYLGAGFLARDDRSVSLISVVRPKSKGIFTQRNARNFNALLRPLMKALEFHGRLAAVAKALDHLKEGMFLIDINGHIRHANAAGQRMLAENNPVRADGNRLVTGQARVSRYPVSSALGFSGAIEAVFVEPAPKALPVTELFGWTPAEARVAALVSEGRSVREIANQAKLTEHTVRNQLKHAMHKAAVRRQAELTALIWRARTLVDPSGNRAHSSIAAR
jgi:DNA-binding CsgD family transcriptional regulator